MFRVAEESGALAQKPEILRHNLAVNVMDGMFWVFGVTFVSSSTILPVYLSHLTTSAIIIGMIPALELAGWAFPQIFTAPLFEGRPRMKGYVLFFGMVQRVTCLIIAILIWSFTDPNFGSSQTQLLLFLALYAAFAFCGGITAIPWQEMVSRLFSLRQRGRFYAAQRFFGGLLGLAGAFTAGWLLSNVAFPYNFAWCFFCAFAAMSLSWFILTFTHEPAQEQMKREARSPRAYASELWILLRQDRAFVWYLIARAVGYVGWMATAFFAVYAVKTFQLQDAQAAIFNGLLVFSGIGANIVWGWLGDKYSQKLVLILSSSAYVLALVLATFAQTVYVYYAIFCLVGIASTGLMVSDLTLVVEFAPEARRPTYMGLARGIWVPFIGLSPLLGGILWGDFGYDALIWASLILTLFGIVLAWWRVREPRARNAENSTRSTPAVMKAAE